MSTLLIILIALVIYLLGVLLMPILFYSVNYTLEKYGWEVTPEVHTFLAWVWPFTFCLIFGVCIYHLCILIGKWWKSFDTAFTNK